MRWTTLLMVCLVFTSFAHAATTSLQRADELLAQLKSDPWEQRKDGSAIAWNEAYVLDALIDLYDATGDAKYLRQLVTRSDRVISHRDDKRGFADYTGRAHKRWSIDSKYTIATAALVSDAAEPTLWLVSTTSANNHITSVSITRQGERFTLKATNPAWKREESFTDLSIDPNDARYFAKVINDPTPFPKPPPGSDGEHSQLLRVEPVREDQKVLLPKEQTVKLKPQWDSHAGYVGIVYHPMLKLAQRVKKDPKLAELKPAADRFIAAAEESFADVLDHWREGRKPDEGYYLSSMRGGATPFDGVCMPFNYQAKMACSELALFELTNKPIYKEHALRIATLFKNRLEMKTSSAGELYVWKYWFEPMTVGWDASAKISDHYPVMKPYLVSEDSSHATLDIAMVIAMHDAGLIFDDTDLRRFANTFLVNVARGDHAGLNAYVDGKAGNEQFESAAVFGWVPLAQVDADVLKACRDIYLKRDKEDFKSLARLVLWEKRIETK
jgi:hypothetical protein